MQVTSFVASFAFSQSIDETSSDIRLIHESLHDESPSRETAVAKFQPARCPNKDRASRRQDFGRSTAEGARLEQQDETREEQARALGCAFVSRSLPPRSPRRCMLRTHRVPFRKLSGRLASNASRTDTDETSRNGHKSRPTLNATSIRPDITSRLAGRG